jgi:hypothetical protein
VCGVALDYGSLDGCGYVRGEWCVALIGFAARKRLPSHSTALAIAELQSYTQGCRTTQKATLAGDWFGRAKIPRPEIAIKD